MFAVNLMWHDRRLEPQRYGYWELVDMHPRKYVSLPRNLDLLNPTSVTPEHLHEVDRVYQIWWL